MDGRGISPAQAAPEQGAQHQHYAILGVPATASLDEVKQAYRRKAREYHPDLHPDEKEKYTAKMADINAAFDGDRQADEVSQLSEYPSDVLLS